MIALTARRPPGLHCPLPAGAVVPSTESTPVRQLPGGLSAFPDSSPPDAPPAFTRRACALGGAFLTEPAMLLTTGPAVDEVMALEGEQILGAARCVVRSDPILPDGAKWLRSLYCDPKQRRTGAASRLMRSIIAQADAARVILVLHPLAGDADGDPDAPDTQALERWYRSLGFFTLQKSPLLLVKAPDAGRVQGAGRG